ncbi:MAG TPA: DNA topoisomerase IB [Conexibacter sp.]|nr:DNA topoisomerase IB [Conexibacter sp.]
MPRTRHVDCSGPGIARRRRGRGFTYLNAEGTPVRDEATIDRIRALAIPPAWSDVWICSDARGHIQATGTDAAGRKQYRYHDDWRRRRDQAKFDAMIAFARALPALRRRVARDLAGEGDGAGDGGLGEARVLACAVRLLDVGLFRIGGEDYAAQNDTYGLTTLRRSHVRVQRDGLLFDFPAKHGQRRVQHVADSDVRPVIAALKRRRGGGEELLAFRRSRRWVDVKAEDVNAYLKDAADGDFSAKDFRTWNATALCAVALAERAESAGASRSRTSSRRLVKAAIDEVATFLGNTPAVARTSYVDPRVIDRFEEGLTVAAALAADHETIEEDEPIPEQNVSERVRRAVLDLIAGEEDARDVDKIAA